MIRAALKFIGSSCGSTRPLIAFVSLYRAQEKAFETQPMKVAEAWGNRFKTMPIQFNVALNDLPPGKYNCQVTVLDSGGAKAAFWQAPVMVVQ